ncbi:hypothetical protein [Rhizorhabdus sp.]|uniref:hypothetical protein n=1 Tax=Rhizorhabdus sp. TaxID=1968843 RepID=UPI0035B03FD1
MPSATRPYFVNFQGKDVLVDAVSKEQAIAIVVAPHVKDVRVAKAGEVMSFYQAMGGVTSPNEDPVERKPIGEDDQD